MVSSLLRGSSEVISDNLLLMYLVSRARKRDLGITKLQKLAFLVEATAANRDTKTYNYRFYKWHHGPLSNELYQDHDELVANNIITPVFLRLTKRGENILQQATEVFEDNQEVTDKIDEIILKYDRFTLGHIKQLVYKGKIHKEGQTLVIGEVPDGTELLAALSDTEAITKFEISDTWIETLDILLDEEYCKSVDKAMKEAKTGRIYSYDEVFMNV